MQHHNVVIIGSGFGGQAMAIKLKKSGITDFVMLERRSFAGGTWCQNKYPGAAVDVHSPLYSLSDEPYDWSQMFAQQQELEQYTHHVIEKNKLGTHIRTDSNVTEIRWLPESSHWQISINGAAAMTAQFVINSTGPLSNPVIPDFPGKDSFEGASFHTNQWNHEVDYRGKRVAVIGSGASAVQVIPAITGDVEMLHVFQRTPHWVMPRPDYHFSNWQRKLLRLKPFYKLLRGLIYLELESRVLGFKYSHKVLKLAAENKARKHLQQQVDDVELRQQLTPDFTIGCKRILLSNTFYPALCQDHVELHDKSDGIAEINASGIRTHTGKQIDVDVIVYATGFDTSSSIINAPIIGKTGESLQSAWSEFPRAYMGTVLPNFPNLFLIAGPNTGVGHTSAIVIMEAQMKYILSSIKLVNDQSARCIEVKEESEQRYTQHIHNEMQRTVWQAGGCDSWYKGASGRVTAMFPGFTMTYRRWARNLRRQDHQVS